MSTMFRRQFVLITVLLLLCMLFTGVAYRFWMLDTVETENQRTLYHDAKAAAAFARAYNTTGELESNWDFRMGLSFVSSVSDAEALICDPDGVVRLCSCEQFLCEHIGKTVDAALLRQIDASGSVVGSAGSGEALSELYSDSRSLAGVPIISASAGQTIGYVIVSAPTTQLDAFMRRSSTLFLATAALAIVIALAAASLLSRTQVRPLAQVAEAARQFGHGDFETRVSVPPSSPEEILELATAFNTMAESIQRAEQRRDEFVANVSHELKTPMTSIGGFIDWMLDWTIPPEQHAHYMQIVQQEVRRLSRLVRSMLDVSRLQAKGVEESRKTRFDIAEIISDVLISFEQKINNRRLQVSVNLPDRALFTRADRDGIQQVLYNLVDNAIKFCPEGGMLGIRLAQEGGKAVVSVQNTGKTIPPGELPLLFERFHKADRSRSADRESWGLGLYIVKTILDAHGEDIRAESHDGVTTFRFTLSVVR